MGRHRRSAPETSDDTAAISQAAGAPLTSESTERSDPPNTPTQQSAKPFPANSRSPFGASVPPAGTGRHRSPRRGARSRAKGPVRTGLLGASAAMAMGAVVVASGLLPGGSDTYTLNSGSESTRGRFEVEEPPEPDLPPDFGDDLPRDLLTQRPRPQEPREPDEREWFPAHREAKPSHTPSAAPWREPAAEPSASAPPSPRETGFGADPRGGAAAPPEAARTTSAPSAPPPSSPPPRTDDPAVPDAAQAVALPRASVAAHLLALVNRERVRAGRRPVRADARLARLAQDFSEDMARRGFFAHTDPDGRTPWDRAAKRGITTLGGENIARGHSDAQAVMEAWMRSPGHRRNILNGDYRTIGIGMHSGPGGPWWTQEFGY
ncbi:CAP domain-containing protein [Streptomyces syringium]|uniref:CAP domain-containing protein n=1 Tax=Streptomyces syringium TaxID=76729 RepID=UPI003F576BE8